MGHYNLLRRLKYLASWLGAYTPGLLFVEGMGDLGPSPGLFRSSINYKKELPPKGLVRIFKY